MSEQSFIEVYPVGLFRDLRSFRAEWLHGSRKFAWYLITRRIRDSWRRRSYWNGYLAEWHYCPDGVAHFKCGAGWTRRLALHRLGVHIAEQNVRKEDW